MVMLGGVCRAVLWVKQNRKKGMVVESHGCGSGGGGVVGVVCCCGLRRMVNMSRRTCTWRDPIKSQDRFYTVRTDKYVEF